ncbi:MAG: HlyD family secretion protein [Pirellula sp.]
MVPRLFLVASGLVAAVGGMVALQMPSQPSHVTMVSRTDVTVASPSPLTIASDRGDDGLPVRFISGQTPTDPPAGSARPASKLVQLESSPNAANRNPQRAVQPPAATNPSLTKSELTDGRLVSAVIQGTPGALSYSGVLSFVNDIPIPAQTDGIIQELFVDEGNQVTVGMTMIEIDNRLAKAEEQVAEKELESARLKAEDDSQIKFSKASYDVASNVFNRSQELYTEGVEALDDWEKKRLEKIKAYYQISVSEREQKINEAAVGVNNAKLNASRVQVELRTLKAPFAGVVAEMKKERYEWVKAGEEIMRLVSLEKFRVKGSVRISESPNVLERAPAKVYILTGQGKTVVVDGVVGFVKPESEGSKDGMNEYRVWVEIPNRIEDGKYLFRGSMDARVEIFPAR